MALKLFAILTLVLWLAVYVAGVGPTSLQGHAALLVLGVIASVVLAIVALVG